MNRWRQFERLAAEARAEPAPTVSVSDWVLRDIRCSIRARSVNVPLLVFSGLSVAAASIMLVFAVQSWNAMTDPFLSMFDTLTMVIQ